MKKGYTMIIIVLALLVLTTSSIVAVSFLANGNLDQTQDAISSEQALYSTQSCLEEAFLRLKNDPAYSGGSISFPEGSCDISSDSQDDGYIMDTVFFGEKDFRRSLSAKIKFDLGVLKIIDWGEKHLMIE